LHCTGILTTKKGNKTSHTVAYTLNTKVKLEKTVLANKKVTTPWFGTPRTTFGEETEQAILLQPRSQYGAKSTAAYPVYGVMLTTTD